MATLKGRNDPLPVIEGEQLDWKDAAEYWKKRAEKAEARLKAWEPVIRLAEQVAYEEQMQVCI